jgi:AcrR family transcriptional regulator
MQADGDDQRQRLLAAAGDALLECGYLALTEVDITDRAGVCHATFDAHFADKHDCLLAAHRAASAELDIAISTACSAAPAWPHDVIASVRAAMELFAASPSRASLIALGAAGVEGELAAAILAANRRLADRLRAAAVLAGAPEEQAPAWLDEMMIAGAYWLVASRLREGEAARLPALAAEIAQLLLLAYLDLEQAQDAVSTDSETNGLP